MKKHNNSALEQLALDLGSEAADSTAAPKKKRKRDSDITFRVTEEEKEMINRRMAQTGMKNRRAYLLKMAIDGRVIHVEFESIREMVRLLSNISNNINQIARRCNQTGNFYAADMEELRLRHEEIWAQTKVIMRKLSEL
jgi:uncharacterized protein (DUF1778 family)